MNLPNSPEPIFVPEDGARYHPDVTEFALSFNGYSRLGSFEAVATLAHKIEQTFEENGTLPEDLPQLRAALFFEQRAIRHNGNEPRFLPPTTTFLGALVAKIRTVSGGSVPGPPDPLP